MTPWSPALLGWRSSMRSPWIEFLFLHRRKLYLLAVALLTALCRVACFPPSA